MLSFKINMQKKIHTRANTVFTVESALPQPSSNVLEFQMHEPNQSRQASAHHSKQIIHYTS